MHSSGSPDVFGSWFRETDTIYLACLDVLHKSADCILDWRSGIDSSTLKDVEALLPVKNAQTLIDRASNVRLVAFDGALDGYDDLVRIFGVLCEIRVQ